MSAAVECRQVSQDPAPVWTSILAALASIQHQQQCLAEAMQHQQDTLAASQASFVTQQQHLSVTQDRLLQRIVNLERHAFGDDHVPRRAVANASEQWPCPLCGKGLQDRHSFKGHIRRLVKQSSRPKCHLNPRDEVHQSLVHRFSGADFYTQARNFCAAFQSFVARAISKTRPDEISRRLVQEWLEAAHAIDGHPFPVCSYSSGPESDPTIVGNSGDAAIWSSSSAL
jgi:hypothetical protein